MLLKDYLRLIRPYNLGFIAMGMLFARNMGFVWWQLVLLLGATLFIAAGAFVINDYFDVKIDRINKPELLIITHTVSKAAATRYSLSLTGIGIAMGLLLAYLQKNMSLATIYILVPGLLWFYSSSYKRILLVGDLVLSACVALIPLTMAMVVGTYEAYTRMLLAAGSLFLITWVIILVESIMNIEGERELECHTIPVVFGETVTYVLIFILSLCALFLPVTVHVVGNC